MSAVGIVFILLASVTFTFGLIPLSKTGGDGDLPIVLALFAAALLISGAILTSAAALNRRLQCGLTPPARHVQEDDDEEDARPAASIRRPGYHRRAA